MRSQTHWNRWLAWTHWSILFSVGKNTHTGEIFSSFDMSFGKERSEGGTSARQISIVSFLNSSFILFLMLSHAHLKNIKTWFMEMSDCSMKEHNYLWLYHWFTHKLHSYYSKGNYLGSNHHLGLLDPHDSDPIYKLKTVVLSLLVQRTCFRDTFVSHDSYETLPMKHIFFCCQSRREEVYACSYCILWCVYITLMFSGGQTCSQLHLFTLQRVAIMMHYVYFMAKLCCSL